MQVKVQSFAGTDATDLELNDEVFGLEPRADILHRVVTWQLEKRRATARGPRERSDVARTGKKFGRQKGGGTARHGDRRAPIFVGGGKAHGPRVRDFNPSLNKKVRAAAMRQKELRIALICYGGVSLAVYMHGVTKEVWHLARASRAFHARETIEHEAKGSAGIYRELLQQIAAQQDLALRVLREAGLVRVRGEGDVAHPLAAADAAGILRFLVARGVVRDEHAAPLPPLRCLPTPLAGSIPLVAPHGGMVVFLREPGAEVAEGEPLVEVIDPITGRSSVLGAGTAGLFFAHENRRFAVAGMSLGKVAGADARRQGSLLSA